MKALLILLLWIPAYAYSGGVDSVVTNRFLAGLVFSPDYCYRKLASDDQDKSIVQLRDTIETAKFGYSAGMQIHYYFRKRISFETGFIVSDKGEKTKKYPLTFGDMIDPRYGFIYPVTTASGPTLKYMVFNYHYYYLSIPLKINYTLAYKKLKMFPSIGLSTDFYLTNKTTLILIFSDNSKHRKQSKNKLINCNAVNFSIVTGLGVSYDLNSRITLVVQPEYRRSLSPIENTPIKEYLYSVGVNTGLYYRFKHTGH